jgi:hypothetical protein
MESSNGNENTLVKNERCEMFLIEAKSEDGLMEEIHGKPNFEN